MPVEHIQKIVELLRNAIEDNHFAKMTLSKSRQKNNDLKRVSMQAVRVKNNLKMMFTYRYEHRDEVKNHPFEEVPELVYDLLEHHFLEANLFTKTEHHSLLLNAKGNGKLMSKPLFQEIKPDLQHDKQKKRLLQASGLHWHLLGMTDAKGNILPSMQHKFKQINKYVEILDSLMAPWLDEGPVRIVDMGAGKGYLTFALFEQLQNKTGVLPTVIGVEMRPDLVQKTNDIAQQSGLNGLSFVEGSIHHFDMPATDILIALHACDTATDDAIAAGIVADAKLIVCAPCCHKQIRREMQAGAKEFPVLQYGIFIERQAEMLTDTLRALIMERNGYQTHIQEFIEADHTPKNILLSGFKTNKAIQAELIDEKINRLKADFGIQTHFLETALENQVARKKSSSPTPPAAL